MPITKATIQDIPALVGLINSAYRGEASTKGWTTEAHLLLGELRTDETNLLQQMTGKAATILKFTDNKNNISGCVFLEKHGVRLYLGMLSVSPTVQAQGIGKKLLSASEHYASEQGCDVVYMTVISVRQELIDWYKRHGYIPTGETKPFPIDERFGIPTQQLEFVVLEKPVLQ